MKKNQSHFNFFLSYGAFFVLFLSCFHLAASERIVSPAPGTWANKQPLVIDTSDGAECFYSLSGTDPLTSGFAYDGPVLVDALNSVTVRVVSIVGDKREESEVSYTVSVPEKSTFSESSEAAEFIKSVSEQPVVDCSSSDAFAIPSALSYRMENGDGAFTAGISLSVDPSNVLARFIPCVVTDGISLWRFVVRLSGGEVGTLAKQNVPFELSDWTDFTFTGKKLIWCIDGGVWSAKNEPQKIDRSVPHVVSWQSVAYESGNPIRTFILPPSPVLKIDTDGAGDKPVRFILDGDERYKMELVSSGTGEDISSSGGLMREALFDTYAGDEASGTAVFAVYCDGVYQGSLSASYSIDRKIPSAPKIESSAVGFYARKSVKINIVSEKNDAVFYSITGPVAVEDNGASELSADSEQFNSISLGNFRLLDVENITLNSGTDNAVFYKVGAYSVDKAGNTSPVSEYKVLIDEYNYWLVCSEDKTENDASPSENFGDLNSVSAKPDDDPQKAADNVDGSFQHPFTSFEQALSVINSSRFTRFHVKGTIQLSGDSIDISSNCAFIGDGKTRFLIPSDSTVFVRSSSFEASGCTFEKQKAADGELQAVTFFSVENGVVSFDNVEIAGIFGQNGTVFSAQKSVVYLLNSGLTVQADTYACAVSSVDSKVTVKNSRLVSIAPTAVVFSVNGGLFELRGSECSVIAHLGRIAELVKTNARMSDNNYIGRLEKKNDSVKPIWKDEGTLTLEDSANTSTGF